MNLSGDLTGQVFGKLQKGENHDEVLELDS